MIKTKTYKLYFLELSMTYKRITLWQEEIDLPSPDNPDQDHSPEGWNQRTYKYIVLKWVSENDSLTTGESVCWKAGES